MTNSLCNKGDDCTKCQAEAAKHFKGPLLIVAGPGAGKTRVLVERVAYLVKKANIDPFNILVITFTVKAAEELKARLSNCIGSEIRSMQISTIHSFCHELLKIYSDYNDLGATFDVLDEEMQLMFLRSNFYRLGLQKLVKMHQLPEVIEFFNECGENLITPNLLAEELIKQYPEEKIVYADFCNSYASYLNLLNVEHKIDFPGLQSNVLKLLQDNPNVLKDVRDRFKFILVDEYQDTNPIQDEFFELISDPNQNICVVGDEDQSIYGFRGADPWNFLRFKEKYECNDVTLAKNFRSTSNIVNLFDDFMENYRHYPKKITPSRECGNGIILLKSNDIQDEAINIVRTIKELKDSGVVPHYGYIALLFRSVRYHAPKIIEELKRNNIPYTVKGQGSFLDRSEIRNMLYLMSYVDPPKYGGFSSWKSWWNISIFKTEFLNLKPETVDSLVNLEKSFDLSQLLRKNDFIDVGIRDEEDISKLLRLNELKKTLSNKEKDLLSVFYDILDISGYLKWLLEDDNEENRAKAFNLAKLSTILNKFEYMNNKPKIKDLIWYLYLLPKNMEYDEEIPDNPHALKIMTVHQAKGLEFPVVFICSVIKNRFPGREKKKKDLVPIPSNLLLKNRKNDLVDLTESAIRDEDIFELEERRLFYVAMTRAQDLLIISTASKINKNRVGYSPYIDEIEKIEEVLDGCASLKNCESKNILVDEPISLSYSSIDTYQTCPFRYKMSYYYGFEYPPFFTQTYGIILHNCLHKLHSAMKNGEKINGVQIKNIVDRCWIQIRRKPKSDIIEKRRLERKLLDYYNDVKNHIKEVISAEEPFSVVKNHMEINGRTDLIIENNEGQIELIDFKAREKSNVDQLEVEFQLKIYEYALQDRYEIDKLCAYTFDDNDKTYFETTDEDIRMMSRKLEKICDKISNEEFEPKENKFCKLCIFKFCC